MHGVIQCKSVIEYFADIKKNDICKLVLKRWNVLRELVAVLQIPFKATIALQNRTLTLSDTFGIWLKMQIFLEGPELKRICKTNFTLCLLQALDNRKQTIMENPAMLCALFLDPRYRNVILRDEQRKHQAVTMLSNLWQRTEFIRKTNQTDTINATQNCSVESSDMNMSFDFDSFLNATISAFISFNLHEVLVTSRTNFLCLDGFLSAHVLACEHE